MTIGLEHRETGTGRNSGTERGTRTVTWWLALVIGLSCGGCDFGFVPPRPSELGGGKEGSAGGGSAGEGASAAGLPSPSATARAIELILPPRDSAQSEMIKTTARSQAGLEKARIQITIMGEKNATAPQADLVRQAAARNPLAVAVEPADPADPEFARVLEEVRDRGVPVILFGQPFAEAKATESGKTGQTPAAGGPRGRLVRVEPESFTKVAKTLVEAAVNNTFNAKLLPQDGAVLMVNTTSDSLVEQRVAAFREALREVGVTTVDEVRFDQDSKAAKSKLVGLLISKPKLGMVLATDRLGLSAAYERGEGLSDDRHYVMAGFSSEESGGTMVRSGEFAALAIFSPERLIRKVIIAAASLGRGESVPDRVELMVPAMVSPSSSTTPRMYKMMATQKAMRTQSQRDPKE